MSKSTDLEELVHEAFWTGTGWKGQAVEINFTRTTYKIIWTSPNEYDEEEVAHRAVLKWARDEGWLIRRVNEAECHEKN